MTLEHKNKILVSVVMPTHNRAALLEAAVDSILRQNFAGEFELIVVDDGSTDCTLNLLRRIQKERSQRLRFVSQQNRGPASARNRGLDLARGEIVAFMDDDCEAALDWLEKISSAYQADPKLACIGGQTSPAEKGTIFRRYLDFRIMRKPHQEKDSTITLLLTNNCSFRKTLVQEVGKFDERIPVSVDKNKDLCIKLRDKGYHFSFQPEARVVHHHPVTMRGFVRICLNYGQGEVIRLRHFSPTYKIIRTLWWGRVALAWVWIPLEAYQFWKKAKIKPADAFLFASLHWLQQMISCVGGFRAWRHIVSKKDQIHV
jgi:glycosyltransferase involved in cell wall biosynthesis